MSDFSFVLPADFDEYAWEVEAKGCFSEAFMIVGGTRYRLNFYDPVRLAQQVETVLEHEVAFFETNIVIVRSVTRYEMQKAVELFGKSVQVADFVPDLST